MGVQLGPASWSVTLVRRLPVLAGAVYRQRYRTKGAAVVWSSGRSEVVHARLQNSIAVLAVMAAIALLAVTLVVPRKSLLLVEMPATYANAR